MKFTIEVPDHLVEPLNKYLEENPRESLSTLVKEILEIRVIHRDLSELLALSGIVTKANQNNR